jgi:DNA helicase-2/ATP-dependent DNA helicase PcrA
MNLLDGLNDQQREAVTRIDGPLLILAGAGSGKTRVITHRIAYLLSTGECDPSNILAVTFTNKAAAEMKERASALIDMPCRAMACGTFHSMCARMLRLSEHVNPRFVVYDETDTAACLKTATTNLGYDPADYAPRDLADIISTHKTAMRTPQDAAEIAGNDTAANVAAIYAEYQKVLRASNALDFDDLICETVRMLQGSASAALRWQDTFRYILVDEYQDVNYPQYLLIHCLANHHRNLCVVGDDDQSIYRFRGSDMTLMLRFREDYPDAHVVKLERNYRSTTPILDAAHRMVALNPARMDKRIWTDTPGADVSVRGYQSEKEEAEAFATACASINARGGRLDDIAALYRTNAQSRALEDALMRVSLPYVIAGGTRYYDRKEIRDLLSYLRTINNTSDAIAIKRGINSPARGVGPSAFAALEKSSRDRGISIWSTLTNEDADMTPRARRGCNEFVRVILEAQRTPYGTCAELVGFVLKASGLVAALEEDRDEGALARADNLREFVTVAQNYDADADEPSLGGFLETIALVSDIDSMGEGNAVRLMTLHASKGLEFDAVWVTGCEETLLPHSRSMGSADDIAEERRLCYVGMTRAKRALVMTHVATRRIFGNETSNKRSRFLREAGL